MDEKTCSPCKNGYHDECEGECVCDDETHKMFPCDGCGDLIAEGDRMATLSFGFAIREDFQTQPCNDMSGNELELCLNCAEEVQGLLLKKGGEDIG